LALVQEQLGVALDRMPAGPIRALSLCAGQGRDLIGALAGHERREDVKAHLIELDEHNVEIARRAARLAGLEEVEVVAGDASSTDACAGAVPANLVLVCGLFGNISPADIQRTIGGLPQLCADDAMIIWTRHCGPPDLTPTIRRWFSDRAFQELTFERDTTGSFAVGTHRLTGPPASLRLGERLFTFRGFWSEDLGG